MMEERILIDEDLNWFFVPPRNVWNEFINFCKEDNENEEKSKSEV